MGTLLFDSQPLVIIPELAAAIGLNEAIVLQQLHYWVQINRKLKRNFHDGMYWTYNTVKQWQEQFPWWSEKTIRTTLAKLEREGWVLTGNYNRDKMNRTKWYAVNYDTVSAFGKSFQMQEVDSTEYTTETSNRDFRKKENIKAQQDVAPPAAEDVPEVTYSFKKPKRRTRKGTELVQRYGEEKVSQAMETVDWYVDRAYPHYRGKPHPRVDHGKRYSFAEKILDCCSELELSWSEINTVLHHAVQAEALLDPTIFLVTSPKTLGMWIEKYHGYEILHGTIYDLWDEEEYA